MKNITLGELKNELGIVDEILNPVQESINELKIKHVSKYFTERNNIKQDFELFSFAYKSYKMYKAVRENSIKYKVVRRFRGIDHVVFLTTEKKNRLLFEPDIFKVLKTIIDNNIK